MVLLPSVKPQVGILPTPVFRNREDSLGNQGSPTRVSNMSAEAVRKNVFVYLSANIHDHVLPEQESSVSTYSHVHVSGEGVKRIKQETTR